MAITREQRQTFTRVSEPYKQYLDDLSKEHSALNGLLKQEPSIAHYVKIRQAILSLKKATLYIRLDSFSQKIQNLRSDTNISTARKEVSNALADLVKLTGAATDMSLTENQEVIERFALLDPKKRVNLLHGFRRVLDMTKEAEGSGKYRWYFPELYMNLSMLAFVFMDFKLYERTRNPGDPGYAETRDHLELLIDTANMAAREYRQKYEMAGKDVGDLQKAIKLLEMLKLIYSFAGNPEEQSRNELNLTSMKSTVEEILKKKKKQEKR